MGRRKHGMATTPTTLGAWIHLLITPEAGALMPGGLPGILEAAGFKVTLKAGAYVVTPVGGRDPTEEGAK